MIQRDVIYTYANGRPIEGRPDPLPANAELADRVAYLRAWNEYADRVTSVVNKSFDVALRAAVRKSL